MAPALEYVALYFTLLLGFTTLSTTTATTTRTCPPLGEVPNGYWDYRNFYNFKHGYVRLICPVGYRTSYLSSSGTASETPYLPVVCLEELQKGKWSADETSVACVPPNGCPVLEKPHPDATLSFYYNPFNFTVSELTEVKVSVTCPLGHKLNRGLGRTVEIVCLENGKWSEEGLACEGRTTGTATTIPPWSSCPPLGEVPNGYWNYRNFYNFKHGYVLLVCPVGYKTSYLSSNGTASVLSIRETPYLPVACLPDGKWSADETSVACVPPNGCPVLEKPHPDATLSFQYQYITSEVRVSVTCPVGHKLNRGLGRTVETVCLENGKWSEEGLACEERTTTTDY